MVKFSTLKRVFIVCAILAIILVYGCGTNKVSGQTTREVSTWDFRFLIPINEDLNYIESLDCDKFVKETKLKNLEICEGYLGEPLPCIIDEDNNYENLIILDFTNEFCKLNGVKLKENYEYADCTCKFNVK